MDTDCSTGIEEGNVCDEVYKVKIGSNDAVWVVVVGDLVNYFKSHKGISNHYEFLGKPRPPTLLLFEIPGFLSFAQDHPVLRRVNWGNILSTETLH
jgi:hypothetical protein